MAQILNGQRRSPLVQAAAHRWIWPLIGALLLTFGVVAARWLTPTLPGPESAEVTFARDMMAHHEQAVEMALIVGDRSTNEQLRTLALDILLTQQAQIGQMQGWLAVWNQPVAGVEPPMVGMGTMMGMATAEQIDALRSLPLAEAEIVFLQLMIRHHQGALGMARAAQDQAKRPEVVRLATAIINSQQSEIASMQQLLEQRGVAVPPLLESLPEQHELMP